MLSDRTIYAALPGCHFDRRPQVEIGERNSGLVIARDGTIDWVLRGECSHVVVGHRRTGLTAERALDVEMHERLCDHTI